MPLEWHRNKTTRTCSSFAALRWRLPNLEEQSPSGKDILFLHTLGYENGNLGYVNGIFRKSAYFHTQKWVFHALKKNFVPLNFFLYPWNCFHTCEFVSYPKIDFSYVWKKNSYLWNFFHTLRNFFHTLKIVFIPCKFFSHLYSKISYLLQIVSYPSICFISLNLFSYRAKFFIPLSVNGKFHTYISHFQTHHLAFHTLRMVFHTK